jgi:hypothetical protein
MLVVTTETETDAPPHRAASHYLWAMLLARIYETLPLVCPNCHAPMRIISFITDAGTVQKILDHLGEPTQVPKSPRHAARRCGRQQWLRSGRVTTPNGICRHSQYRSLSSIKA